jgi:hypothetical protein
MFLDVFGSGVLNLGTAVETATAWIETKPIDFGESSFVKFLDKMIYNIRGRQTSPYLKLEIRGSDDEEGPFGLLDTLDVALEDPGWTDPPGQRYYKFKFIDEVVGVRWALHGFEVHGGLGGEEF